MTRHHLRWPVYWLMMAASLGSFGLMVWLARADEIRWIYQSEEKGHTLVVLHLDQACPQEPPTAAEQCNNTLAIEFWSQGKLWRISKPALEALVAKEAQ